MLVKRCYLKNPEALGFGKASGMEVKVGFEMPT